MPATPIVACDATTVTLPDGRRVLSFGGGNYLGLAGHPAIVAAVVQATTRFGLSATASRETTGNATSHDNLERELESFLGVERALLTPDGYLANIAACQGLSGRCTHAVLDERAHASLTDAAMAAGLPLVRFRHCDPESLASTLASIRPGRALVLSDGVFTSDGAVAPAAALLERLGRDDLLLIDDCHGLGVIGPGGRGSVAAAGIRDPRVVITSSLAKGLGCAGGVVAGATRVLGGAVRSTAYVCTTPVAPALAEGTRVSLSLLRSDPWRVERLAANAERLRTRLHELGLCPLGGTPYTPIVAFTRGSRPEMEQIASGLLQAGFRVPLIAYPCGPAEVYFRLTVTAEHTPEQIDLLASAIHAVLHRRCSTVAEPVILSVAG